MATSLNVSPLTRQVVDAVAECCAHFEVAPVDLAYTAFKTWLKTEKNLDAAELREVSEHIRQVGGFGQVVSAFFASAPSKATLERAEMKGIAKLGRVANTVLVDQELFLRRFEDAFTRAVQSKGKVRPFGFTLKQPKKKMQRLVNVALSDLHFGTDLDPREVPYRYGFTEEARRLASVILRVAEFKTDYRSETSLVAWLGGDIIKGIIHAIDTGKRLAEQVADASWLLYQAFAYLAGRFPHVRIYCSTGNHDRNPIVHPKKAAQNKWDSFATNIYTGLKLALRPFPNVEVVIPRTAHVEYEVFGRWVYATHGDTNLNPGNPGASIHIGSLESQMSRINNARVSRDLPQYGLFVAGHVHIGSLTHPAPGELITNGCLIPPEPYGVSINYNQVKCGQYMWESTEHRLVGDSRFLDVDESTDKDASLDKVIVPWDGEF